MKKYILDNKCRKCKVTRPLRAHHCGACGTCVLKMDHHCPWINNCVGHANHRYFLNFLLYTTFMLLILSSL